MVIYGRCGALRPTAHGHAATTALQHMGGGCGYSYLGRPIAGQPLRHAAAGTREPAGPGPRGHRPSRIGGFRRWRPFPASSVVRGDCTPEGLKGGTEFGAMMARQQLIWQQVAGVLGKRESTLLTSPQVSPPSQVPLSITAQCGREPARLRIVALRAAHGSRSSACAVKLL